ncbi:MAG: hypothetical protein HOP29_00235 [Phycisphaerales bacterium]|nr:hypothetical protein [Phycisphaerales bacterium]
MQRALELLYDVELGHDVEDFVVDANEAREAAGEDAVARREVLLVREDSDGVAVGLYVDAEAVRALGAGKGDAWTLERLGSAGVGSEFLISMDRMGEILAP